MSDGDVYLPSARSTESCDTSYSSSRKEMVVVSTVQPYKGEPRASNESSTFSIKKFFNSLSLPEVWFEPISWESCIPYTKNYLLSVLFSLVFNLLECHNLWLIFRLSLIPKWLETRSIQLTRRFDFPVRHPPADPARCRALLNSSLALRTDLKGLWLLRIPLSIYQFDDHVSEGF